MKIVIGFNVHSTLFNTFNFIQTFVSDSEVDKYLKLDGLPQLDAEESSRAGFYYGKKGNDATLTTANVIAYEKGFDKVFFDMPARSAISTNYYWQAELSLIGANQKTGGWEHIMTVTYGYRSIGGLIFPTPVKVSNPSNNLPYLNRLKQK